MKDKSLKDEKQYQIQFFDEISNTWKNDCICPTYKCAKKEIKYYRSRNKRNGIYIKYRIVKHTIKKEVVR